MSKDLVLVVGASGTVGSELVKQLKAEGYRTRSASSKTSLGPDSVHVNLKTGEGIKQAFEGVDRAFFLSPPPFADQYSVLSPLIQEAKRRGLKKVVLMTAMGANANEASPFRKAEVELEKSGLDYNIIRPNWFFQNFATFWVHGINEAGKILLPAGKSKVSFIDARDIASVAAKLVVSDQFNGEALDLTGPVAIDHAQVAQAIANVAGRPVTYQETSPEDFKRGLLSAGTPEDYANLLVTIMGYLREGYAAPVTSNVERVTGKKARGLNDYVNDFKVVWQK